MKVLTIICILISLNSLLAGENSGKKGGKVYWNKHTLLEESFQSADSLIAEEKEQKSIATAALYSAVIPGTGQYYAGSVWKAIMFAGIEIAGWTAFIVYTSKGDQQDSDMKGFANEKWSERKYWSRLYYDARNREDLIPDLPVYEVDGNDIIIEYDADVVNNLRYLEDALGHTHQLPATKTQQYYEMIYKYLTQFGNGWEDANFYSTYYGNTNNLTPQMFAYRDMRNDMNSYYDRATTATNIILINHVLSALDAALTARNHNREITVKLRAYNKRYFDENVQMLGVNITW
jgi:hypothetical protein